jgi:vacuolar protein sorting-associated protein 13A/C
VLMNSITGNDQAFVRVNVRSGTKSSRYEVVFQLACWMSPYRYCTLILVNKSGIL